MFGPLSAAVSYADAIVKAEVHKMEPVHIDSRPIKRSDVIVCDTCGAVILTENTKQHEEWHKTIREAKS